MLEKLKKDVWENCLELPKNHLVVMTSGTVSARDVESGFVVVKPSGVNYEKIQPEDMVVVGLDGEIIEGNLKPSVDVKTHLYIYKIRKDVNGVTHTHSPYASIFAVLAEPIPCCLTASAMLGGEIPIGGLALVGGEEIGKEILAKIGGKKAIIMQNHGIYTIGNDTFEATKFAVELEEIAKIVHFALSRGKPVPLTEEGLRVTMDIYENQYGQ
jgi:L-ribulose-5-phosphate 4-epimerase